jgi:hypothetical protein
MKNGREGDITKGARVVKDILRLHFPLVVECFRRYRKQCLGHWLRQGCGRLPFRARQAYPPPRIPEALAPTIIEWVKGGPPACGLNRANWTYEELAEQVYRATGIVIKRAAMRKFCQRHKLVSLIDSPRKKKEAKLPDA